MTRKLANKRTPLKVPNVPEVHGVKLSDGGLNLPHRKATKFVEFIAE